MIPWNYKNENKVFMNREKMEFPIFLLLYWKRLVLC